jgi:hypothetical protein
MSGFFHQPRIFQQGTASPASPCPEGQAIFKNPENTHYFFLPTNKDETS